MRSILWYLLAALGEIGGCFAFWAWLRMQKSPIWVVPGVLSLIVFALALTRIEAEAAGRAYAWNDGVVEDIRRDVLEHGGVAGGQQANGRVQKSASFKDDDGAACMIESVMLRPDNGIRLPLRAP